MLNYKKILLLLGFYTIAAVIFLGMMDFGYFNVSFTFTNGYTVLIILALFSAFALENQRTLVFEYCRHLETLSLYKQKFTIFLEHNLLFVGGIILVNGVMLLIKGGFDWFSLLGHGIFLYVILAVLYGFMLANLTKKHYEIKGYLCIIIAFVFYFWRYSDFSENTLWWNPFQYFLRFDLFGGAVAYFICAVAAFLFCYKQTRRFEL